MLVRAPQFEHNAHYLWLHRARPPCRDEHSPHARVCVCVCLHVSAAKPDEPCFCLHIPDTRAHQTWAKAPVTHWMEYPQGSESGLFSVRAIGARH
eukprot:13868240-Alexandrium_andersonii.AAC.1